MSKMDGACCIVLPNIVEIGTRLAVSCFQDSSKSEKLGQDLQYRVSNIVEEVSNRDGACCIVFSNDTEAPSLIANEPQRTDIYRSPVPIANVYYSSVPIANVVPRTLQRNCTIFCFMIK